MTRMTVATLAERVDRYHDAITAMSKGMDARILVNETSIKTQGERISKGEGGMALLIKLIIMSIVVSAGAVVGYVGKQTGLW
ncbi:hypothetical protein LCGC14_2238150 [marine sediment metagenome]|uniref:Uncharacterized protein n=1 Tax=marine sediment metagenome TaxID=412755 RepID=A0A0F9D6E0_9ZZZZ